MTTTVVLRSVAVALAVLGFIDPSWTLRRAAPVPVDLRIAQDGTTTGHGLESTDAHAVSQRLSRDLAGQVAFNAATNPVALVLVGDHVSAGTLSTESLPISTVGLLAASAPGIRIISATSPVPVPIGWTATFEATLEARGLRGTSSRIVLEQDGAEVAHLDHTWTADVEQFDARLSYAPPVEGASRVTLRAGAEAAVDLRAAAIARRLKVLAHEPRPSWATAFVRRALEDDATFDVSSLVRASRALSVRAGTPPAVLTADALNPFDVVLVGAPEELRAAEVDALRAFAQRRGGTVVLLPDRRPSGPYVSLTPSSRFEEVLVDEAIELRASGAAFRASELALPREAVGAGDVLATTASEKPVIVAWPSGIGTTIFSGALDAWRFRAQAGDGFARFWRARIAEAALAAPPRLQVTTNPEVARPGEEVIVQVRLRPTELTETAGQTSVPGLRGHVVGGDRQDVIRLWPLAEVGTFEARFSAPDVGKYNLQIAADNGAAGDDVLTVVADARHPQGAERDLRAGRQLVAAATGGVSVDAADLTPLVRYLRTLPSGAAAEPWHPTRSVWFVVTFVAAACGEWALRRRRGQL